jgi:hypothetical protein
MASDIHHDGGRLHRVTVSHRHVIEHEDGSVSAVVVRGVPALACELCEETYYEPNVTDRIVDLVAHVTVGPGEAVAIDYPKADAA